MRYESGQKLETAGAGSRDSLSKTWSIYRHTNQKCRRKRFSKRSHHKLLNSLSRRPNSMERLQVNRKSYATWWMKMLRSNRKNRFWHKLHGKLC